MKTLIYVLSAVFIVQAMNKPPYKSSPVMPIKGRAIRCDRTDISTTDLLTAVNGYCSRSGIVGDEKKAVKKDLKEMVLDQYPSLKYKGFGEILVYLNKKQDRVPKDALSEAYLIGLLDQLTKMNLEAFLKEYYEHEKLNERQQEQITTSLKNKIDDRYSFLAEQELGEIVVHLVKCQGKWRVDGLDKDYLTSKLDECRKAIMPKEVSSGSDPRLNTLGKGNSNIIFQKLPGKRS